MVHQNYDLTNLNSFRVPARAKYYASVKSLEELKIVLAEYAAAPLLILGGGSNTLFTKDWEGLILSIDIHGIEVVKENENHVWLKVGAGEDWPKLVEYCVEKGWAGIENLALIPGNVGAAPVQNIGAYGTEIKDVLESITALNLKTNEIEEFQNKDCKFGYRDSIFKRTKSHIIAFTVLKLTKEDSYTPNLSYKGLDDLSTAASIKQIMEKVVDIRKSKLPDVNEIGTAGSFFKNPVVSQRRFTEIEARFTQKDRETNEIPHFDVENGVKIPAGWLIEQSGFKGHREGDAAVSANHALILLNHGRATGQQIWDLAKTIQTKVEEEFGIKLEPEVCIH